MKTIFSEEELQRLSKVSEGTFWEYLGCELEEATLEKVVVSIDIQPHHLNMVRILHGGVHASLMDSAMGFIATMHRPGQETVTIQLNVNYLAALKEGKITVEAEVVHASRKMINTGAKVIDQDGRLLATGTAIFRVIDKGA